VKEVRRVEQAGARASRYREIDARNRVPLYVPCVNFERLSLDRGCAFIRRAVKRYFARCYLKGFGVPHFNTSERLYKLRNL